MAELAEEADALSAEVAATWADGEIRPGDTTGPEPEPKASAKIPLAARLRAGSAAGRWGIPEEPEPEPEPELEPEPEPAAAEVYMHPLLRMQAAAVRPGRGRIAASENEAPILFAKLAQRGRAAVRSDNATGGGAAIGGAR